MEVLEARFPCVLEGLRAPKPLGLKWKSVMFLFSALVILRLRCHRLFCGNSCVPGCYSPKINDGLQGLEIGSGLSGKVSPFAPRSITCMETEDPGWGNGLSSPCMAGMETRIGTHAPLAIIVQGKWSQDHRSKLTIDQLQVQPEALAYV